MDKREEIWRSINEDLQKIPPERRHEALQHFFLIAVGMMDGAQIQKLRAQLVEKFGDAHECVQIVDGHLALREIQGGS